MPNAGSVVLSFGINGMAIFVGSMLQAEEFVISTSFNFMVSHATCTLVPLQPLLRWHVHRPRVRPCTVACLQVAVLGRSCASPA